MTNRILIADDNPLARKILARVLDKAGYELLVAKDGREAVELFREHSPDLIVLDVMMPRMSGYEVCRELGSELRQEAIPVLFLSARDDVDGKVQALELGAVDFVTKPFNNQEILAKLRNHLEIQRLTRSLRDANEEMLRKQQRLDEDLAAAADIQNSLVLQQAPEIPGVRTSWKFLPCDEVGGDIFNVVRLDERRWCAFMIDVSGHGVPSAMVTVSVCQTLSPHGSLLKTRMSDPPHYEVRSPAEVLRALDREYPMSRFDKYFTMFYSVLDVRNGTLHYSGAAHPPPVICHRDGTIEQLEAGGSIVGLGGLIPFEEDAVRLAPGDRVFVFTDGLIEVMNSRNECYGPERLHGDIAAARDLDLDEACEALLAGALEFSASDSPDDDISLLAFEVEEAPPWTSPQTEPHGERAGDGE